MCIAGFLQSKSFLLRFSSQKLASSITVLPKNSSPVTVKILQLIAQVYELVKKTCTSCFVYRGKFKTSFSVKNPATWPRESVSASDVTMQVHVWLLR